MQLLHQRLRWSRGGQRARGWIGVRTPQRAVLRRARCGLGGCSRWHPNGKTGSTRPADTRVSGLDRRLHRSADAVREWRLHQRAESRYGGMGNRLLGGQRRAAAHDQVEVRSRQRLLVRAEHPSERVAMKGVRLAIVAFVAGLIPFASPDTAVAAPPPRCSDQSWVGAWAAAPSDASGGSSSFDRVDMSNTPLPAVRDETVRAILTPTAAGATTRVRLSNRFGTVPVTFARATIAHRAEGPAVVPGTAATLTFDGHPSVTAAPGQDVVSDPVDFGFEAFEPLAVSIFVPGDIGKPSEHYVARQTSYFTRQGTGGHTSDIDGRAFRQH